MAYIHILSYFTVLPSLSLWVSYYRLVLINCLLCRLNSVTESRPRQILRHLFENFVEVIEDSSIGDCISSGFCLRYLDLSYALRIIRLAVFSVSFVIDCHKSVLVHLLLFHLIDCLLEQTLFILSILSFDEHSLSLLKNGFLQWCDSDLACFVDEHSHKFICFFITIFKRNLL